MKTYLKKINLFSIISTLILSIALFFTDILNPVLIKWIALLFYISVISSSLLLLFKYSKTLSKTTELIIKLFSLFLIILFTLTLFIRSLSPYWNTIIGLSIIFLMVVQLNILGWSKSRHHFSTKLLFLLSLISNLFLSSIFFFKIDFYEIKPFFILSILISASLLLLGVFIQTKKLSKSVD